MLPVPCLWPDWSASIVDSWCFAKKRCRRLKKQHYVLSINLEWLPNQNNHVILKTKTNLFRGCYTLLLLYKVNFIAWKPRNSPSLSLEISPSENFMFTRNPTNPFTISKPRDQEICEFYVVQECRATDFEAPKLWKGSSGTSVDIFWGFTTKSSR